MIKEKSPKLAINNLPKRITTKTTARAKNYTNPTNNNNTLATGAHNSRQHEQPTKKLLNTTKTESNEKGK